MRGNDFYILLRESIVLRRLNVFTCEDIQLCVNKKLQRAFRRISAIHWDYNLVSVFVEVNIDSRALLRELADEAEYEKPVHQKNVMAEPPAFRHGEEPSLSFFSFNKNRDIILLMK